MFDNYTQAKTKPLPKWVIPTVAASVGMHIAVIFALVMQGYWAIEKLKLPKGGVSIATAAPPPPPPPAKKGSRKKKPVDTKKVVKKIVPKETTQPVRLDKPPEDNEPDIDSDTFGDPDGDVNGVEWSTCTGPTCDVNSPLRDIGPPPKAKVKKKKEPPKIVPQVALEQQRISGEKHIVPNDATKLAIKRDAKTRVVATFKMCLNARGTVSTVKKLRSSGYGAYDRKLANVMRTWKYRPFKVNGRPVPVCTSVTFIYNQRN